MPDARAATSGIRRREQSATLERHSQRFRELKRDLEQLEYFCKGTVLKRMMKCGKAHCACASDPTKRHGPYFELTYKANGKTVNVKLSPEATPLYLANHPAPPGQTGPIPAPRLIAKNRGYPDIPLKATTEDRPNRSNYMTLRMVSRRSKVATPNLSAGSERAN